MYFATRYAYESLNYIASLKIEIIFASSFKQEKTFTKKKKIYKIIKMFLVFANIQLFVQLGS